LKNEEGYVNVETMGHDIFKKKNKGKQEQKLKSQKTMRRSQGILGQRAYLLCLKGKS